MISFTTGVDRIAEASSVSTVAKAECSTCIAQPTLTPMPPSSVVLSSERVGSHPKSTAVVTAGVGKQLPSVVVMILGSLCLAILLL